MSWTTSPSESRPPASAGETVGTVLPAAGGGGLVLSAGETVGTGLPTPAPQLRAEALMRRALEVAAGTPEGDVPVGAVVIDAEGRELAAATNRREADGDPTAHAEILAIRQAVTEHGDGWRLENCALVVTLEPCAMCAGALVAARIGEIIFGAYEPKTGACGSVYEIPLDPRTIHRPAIRGGVLQEECEHQLREFFSRVRSGGSTEA